MTVAADELLARLTEIRATAPQAVQKALAKRRRRPLIPRGSLFLVAVATVDAVNAARRDYEASKKKEQRYL